MSLLPLIAALNAAISDSGINFLGCSKLGEGLAGVFDACEAVVGVWSEPGVKNDLDTDAVFAGLVFGGFMELSGIRGGSIAFAWGGGSQYEVESGSMDLSLGSVCVSKFQNHAKNHLPRITSIRYCIIQWFVFFLCLFSQHRPVEIGSRSLWRTIRFA